MKQNTKMTNIIIKMKDPIPIRIKYVFLESSFVFAPEKKTYFVCNDFYVIDLTLRFKYLVSI